MEDSPLLPIIEEWDWDDKWYTPSQLFIEWRDLSIEEGLYFPFKGVRSLATHLVNVRSSLSKMYGMEWQKSVGRGSRVSYHFPNKVDAVEDTAEDASPSTPEIDPCHKPSGLGFGL
jgi:hypothetical protein